MIKNIYLPRRLAKCVLWTVALFVVLAACGESSNNTTTVTPSPTSTSTAIVSTTNTPPSPTSTQPGKTPTSSQPSPTPSKPTPTPTVPQPSPTPTPKPTPTPAPKVVVMIIVDGSGNFAFSPQTLNITVGTTVTWKNTTSAPHTVTGASFGSGTIPSGGTFSFTFTQSGTFAYHCMIHPYMTGTVIVK